MGQPKLRNQKMVNFQKLLGKSKRKLNQLPSRKTQRKLHQPWKIKKNRLKRKKKNDLEFLESFDKPKKQEEIDEKMENNEEDTEEIVPVQIVKAKETKNLEDWLDDFLDD